jgi:dihydroxyacetone kinase-like protein
VAQTINAQDSIEVIQAIAQAVTGEQAQLSALDSTIGDGDHGVNLAKALQEAARQVSQLESPTLESVWRTTGKTIQNSVGGVSGLLFGAFFLGAGETLKDKQEITPSDVALMLAAGLAAVQQRGKAQPGDKTMVDALAPAARAAQAAADNHQSLGQTLQHVAEAATAGAEATTHMIALQGRAKFLGERSRGFQDAGATSIALILSQWAEQVR